MKPENHLRLTLRPTYIIKYLKLIMLRHKNKINDFNENFVPIKVFLCNLIFLSLSKTKVYSCNE